MIIRQLNPLTRTKIQLYLFRMNYFNVVSYNFHISSWFKHRIPDTNTWNIAAHWFEMHDDVIKWKHFPRYWSFARGIHRSRVNSPHKGQWLGTLMISLICAWINGWVNNHGAGDLRRHCASYDVTVMGSSSSALIRRTVRAHTGTANNEAISIGNLGH